MSTLPESLFVTTQVAARRIGQDFLRPDSDWAPVLFAIGRDGLVISPLFGNADTVRVADLIAGFLQHLGATEAAVVQSTWALRPQHLTPAALKASAAQHPERFEALIVIHADQDLAQMATAQIFRNQIAPPTLAAFTTTEVPLVGPAARIADAIRTGIQYQPREPGWAHCEQAPSAHQRPAV